MLKFGPVIARRLRQLRPKPSPRWHVDEMMVRIAGTNQYLWRAVDDEGEVLDVLVQRRRDQAAARRLMRKLLKKQGFAPAGFCQSSRQLAHLVDRGGAGRLRARRSGGRGWTVWPAAPPP